MKNILKKVIAITCIITLPFTNFEIYADIVEETTEESFLKDKIESELDNETGIIESDIEIELNEAGVFDEEIENLDDETIKLLNEGNEFSVSVVYYGTLDGDESEWKELSDSEVDNLIGNVYGDEIKLHKKNKKSKKNKQFKNVIYNIGKISGLLPEDVYAYADSDITMTSGGKLKQVLILADTNVKNKFGDKLYHVSSSARWLISPDNRKIDVMGVTLENATYDKFYRPAEATYSAVKSEKLTKKEVIEYPEVYCTERGVAFDVNLWNDQHIRNLNYEYNQHYMLLSFYVTIDDVKNRRYFSATSHYWHQEALFQFQPSFSFSTGGTLSVSLGSSVNKMVFMKVNPTLKYYFK